MDRSGHGYCARWSRAGIELIRGPSEKTGFFRVRQLQPEITATGAARGQGESPLSRLVVVDLDVRVRVAPGSVIVCGKEAGGPCAVSLLKSPVIMQQRR